MYYVDNGDESAIDIAYALGSMATTNIRLAKAKKFIKNAVVAAVAAVGDNYNDSETANLVLGFIEAAAGTLLPGYSYGTLAGSVAIVLANLHNCEYSYNKLEGLCN